MRGAVTGTGWSNRIRHFRQLLKSMNRSLTLFPLLPLLSYFSFLCLQVQSSMCVRLSLYVSGTVFNNLDDVTLLSFVLHEYTQLQIKYLESVY